MPGKPMNIHHLELFYYVAAHGGISEAVRRMPYGIQQPAVSSQILQLEDDLGVKLFNRRPFQLTEEGEKLYKSIRPFFANLEKIADEIRPTRKHRIRIGASEIVLREHLPPIIEQVRRHFPGLSLSLRSGYQQQIEAWLLQDMIDLAVIALSSPPTPPISAQVLTVLPLVLLVPKGSPFKKAKDIWACDKIEETLISLPSTEPITDHFQKGLAAMEIDWPIGIEASSLMLIQEYVLNGYGVGLTVAIPNNRLNAGLRVISLEGFDPVEVAVLWQGQPAPLAQAFIEAMGARARNL